LFEQAADHSGITRDNLEATLLGILAEVIQARVAMGGVFAEVRDSFETLAGSGELLEHSVFDAAGHHLGVSASAIENFRTIGHGKIEERRWKGNTGAARGVSRNESIGKAGVD
jgi:hypothetical protein